MTNLLTRAFVTAVGVLVALCGLGDLTNKCAADPDMSKAAQTAQITYASVGAISQSTWDRSFALRAQLSISDSDLAWEIAQLKASPPIDIPLNRTRRALILLHNLYNPAAVYSIEQKQKIIAAAFPYLTNKADYVALNASVILGMIGDPRGVEGLKRLESLSIMGVGDYAAGYLNTIRERRSNGVYGRDIVVGGVHSLLPGLDSAAGSISGTSISRVPSSGSKESRLQQTLR